MQLARQTMCKPCRGTGRGERAFTLLELLVVIGIIGLLIGIMFPVVNAALNKAYKGRAQSEMAHLVAAIRSYYGDAGAMPVPIGDNGDPDRTYGGKGYADSRQNIVINILRGIDTTNGKGRAYFDLDQDSLAGTDLAGNNYDKTEGYYLDPWGNPYLICMDTDFDGSSRFSGLASPPARSSVMIATGVIAGAVSYGSEPARSNSLLSSVGFN
jgi:prepilin-type N-terminal cleavage/methylation domain-containing protein